MAYYQAARALERDRPDALMVDAMADVPEQVPMATFRAEALALDRAEFRRMMQQQRGT